MAFFFHNGLGDFWRLIFMGTILVGIMIALAMLYNRFSSKPVDKDEVDSMESKIKGSSNLD